MKILFLHGYTQTGPLFAKKCSALTQLLSDAGYQSIFASAPYYATNADPKYGGSGLEMRSWWTLDEHDPDYLKMDRALATLRETISTHGPFDGVLGFSQGAGLAGAICTRFPELFGQQPLKFAIFVGGFVLSAPFYQHLYEKPLSIPTCHVLGEYDTIVSEERSMALVHKCLNPVLVRHPGNHYVPTRKPYTEQILRFVESTI